MRRALVSNHILMRRGNSGCALYKDVRHAPWYGVPLKILTEYLCDSFVVETMWRIQIVHMVSHLKNNDLKFPEGIIT